MGNDRAIKVHDEYINSFEEGYILADLNFQSEKDDLDGIFFMNNYILKEFPEAKLHSWDKF